tara:strand:+ start:35 stop:1303 length:1269 start_codon:yes stop_codon:yes gene_type:complete
MDEEQPQKKITLSNFFEQIVEVNKVANAALTNSNNLRSQLNAVQLDLKRLVESLQVNFDSGVQNVQTQINEVTNVIVDDQRIKQSETDALEEQIFAQEDRLQKQTKGQKAKPTSSDGNLLQRAASSIENKAKSNLLATGLYTSSFLLAGLTGKRKESDYEKNRKRNRPKVKSDGNFFTNFFKRNDSKEDNKEKVIENKNKEVVKNIEKKITPANITNNNITNNNITNNNVVKKIIEEKKPDLVASTNDDFDLEKHVASITVTSDTDDEEYVPFKYEHPYDPENYQKSIEEMTARIVADEGVDEAEAKKYATEFVMKEVDRRKKFLVEGKDYHPLFKPPGSDKPRPTMETVNKAYELGVSVDTVKDGGTTIIDGGTEVVNENVNTGQKRGVVRVDSPKVKSSLSSVSVINIAEDNSVSNLSIS